jgi:ferredoxin
MEAFAMKARVDPVKCEGFGDCNETLPDVFLLDEWGYAYTVDGGVVPEGKEGAARLAEAGCPVHAIIIES